jgi:alpha-tubulin suppressor-like RCC1 family protein
MLDVDMVLAMAPGLDELVVIETKGSVATALHVIATGTPKINQFSVSLDFSEALYDVNIQNALYQAAALGQSVFVSSGDYGAFHYSGQSGQSFEFMYTNVGGTELSMNGVGASYKSDTSWWWGSYTDSCGRQTSPIGSGGGYILDQPIPDYQLGISLDQLGGSLRVRNMPDVSMPADNVLMCLTNVCPVGKQGCPCTGGPGGICLSGLTCTNGACCSGDNCTPAARAPCFSGVGTSAATPLWAGYMALANEASAKHGLPPVGFANPVLYALGKAQANNQLTNSVFNDINDGSSIDGPAGKLYTAAGYDLATGWGTPQCELISQLSSSSPAQNLAVSSGGHHTCAIRNNGMLYCWGQNDHGQLGNGTNTDSTVPVAVSAQNAWTGYGSAGGINAIALSAHYEYTCALMSDLSVWCWGDNNWGQLGNGTFTDSSIPVKVTGLSDVNGISAGGTYACALLNTDNVECWGGHVSDGINPPQPPTNVLHSGGDALSDVSAISTGSAFSCAIVSTDHHVECWGSNTWGQLGNGGHGDADPTPAPVVMDSSGILLVGATAISAGDVHTCALLTGGQPYCWGLNTEGELGNGTVSQGSDYPVPVTGVCGQYTALSAGGSVTCGILQPTPSCGPNPPPGSVWCWGAGENGVLGNGSNQNSPSPVQVVELSNINSVIVGDWDSCAINQYGIACWGANTYGEVGNGTTTTMYSPSTVHFF